ncbi:spermidine synthase [Endozoicomonas sp. SM1973]|uniref:Spermidine synthase n=1 Tax=Spartinivicinus marinus TaxID=2994442 RepID=A0A853I8U7_9GAMM|nr:spermidine synthase [Spartinivicinus marinus]MCX4028340.1 hypothetical protein [Spartinivicinus marinus]NYZ65675.1 spermidine synthase [Spartinivicinus marinus]
MSTLAINDRITLLLTNAANRNILILVFFLSGFSGLIYESIWTQYLKLFLGHAAYAQTLVLIIFMGGMALGAWLTSKYLHKFSNLFLAYAIVEAIIGLLALVFHNIYVASTDFAYNTVMPFLGSSGPIEIFKWSLATLLILPQTILLGSTFPLMSAGFIHYFPEKKGHSLSILYFSNSFGAAIGVLVAGFYLVRTVGLPGTLLTAGLINFAVALVTWFISKQFASGIIQPPHLEKQETADHRTLKILLIVAAMTGAASFMYEVAWIRMLSMVLGSSVHSFELMLSAFILGLAIGGFWIRNKISNIANPIQWLGFIQIIMGILAALTITFYNYTFDFMAFTMQALQRTEPGYIYFNLISHFICLVMMLPATICAGMTLPLITYILLNKGYNERAIGWVYSSNTVGSILGVAIAVQLIMPLLGLKNLIISGSILDILMGFFLLTSLAQISKLKIAAILIIPFLISFLKFDQLKMASGVYRKGTLVSPESAKIIYHKDGKTATISVIEYGDKENSMQVITTNGKPDAGITHLSRPASPDEDTMILSAAIPLALHNNPKQVAVIGMGSGLTSHVFLSSDRVNQVDTIEIEPAMVEGAKNFYERNHLAYEEAKSNIHIADAKTFFSSNQKKYDIIMSEPSNPWVSGVASLFTHEYYSLIKKSVKEDGLFVQWLQAYEISPELALSIFSSLDKVFYDYHLYASNPSDYIIIASPNKVLHTELYDIFSNKKLASELKRINHESITDLKTHHITYKPVIKNILLAGNIQSNSDFFPIVQENADKTRFMNSTAASLIDLRLVSILNGTQQDSINPERISKNNSFEVAKAALNSLSILSKDNIPTSIEEVKQICKNNKSINKWIREFSQSANNILWIKKETIIKFVNNHSHVTCNNKKIVAMYDYYKSIAKQNHYNILSSVKEYIKQNKSIDLQMRLNYLFSLIKLNKLNEAELELEQIKLKTHNNLIVIYLDSLLKTKKSNIYSPLNITIKF